jgi:hypothetical protein
MQKGAVRAPAIVKRRVRALKVFAHLLVVATVSAFFEKPVRASTFPSM